MGIVTKSPPNPLFEERGGMAKTLPSFFQRRGWGKIWF